MTEELHVGRADGVVGEAGASRSDTSLAFTETPSETPEHLSAEDQTGEGGAEKKDEEHRRDEGSDR